MKFRLIKFILFTAVSLGILSGCSVADKLYVSWKYRKDYKVAKSSSISLTERKELSKNNKDSTAIDSFNDSTLSVSVNQFATAENKSEAQKASGHLAFALSQKSTLNTHKKQIFNSKEIPKSHVNKQDKTTPTETIIGFVMALLGYALFYLGIPFAIASVILGIIGLSKTERKPDIHKGKGLAIASIVLGALYIILFALLVYFFFMTLSKLM